MLKVDGLTNHTCLYSPAAKHQRPLAGIHCAYHGGMARLSWTGWLVTWFPAPGVEPWTNWTSGAILARCHRVHHRECFIVSINFYRFFAVCTHEHINTHKVQLQRRTFRAYSYINSRPRPHNPTSWPTFAINWRHFH